MLKACIVHYPDEQKQNIYINKYFIYHKSSYMGMRWSEHVARMGERKRHIQGFIGGNLRERGRLGDPGVDGRII